LPEAKYTKNDKIMSISGGLRRNKEFEFIEVDNKNRHIDEGGEEEDDGIITVKRSELVDREEYEREKIRQVSRAEFEQERYQRMMKMMPNKNDRSKNNIRALAFDVSGNMEQDRIKSQKTFQNSRKKYGW
jgi:hypothetical protein